jgi:SAM-dependent methyltransferase
MADSARGQQATSGGGSREGKRQFLPAHLKHIPYEPPPGKHCLYETIWKVRVVEVLESLSLDPSGTRVLDFGCGRGELLYLLANQGYQVNGIDLDPECVRISQRYAPCEVGSYWDLDALYGPDSFDVVCSLHTIEHIPNPVECVQALTKVSRKYLILAVPNLATPTRLEWRRRVVHQANEGHVCGWDFSHFASVLRNYCDLSVVRFVPDIVEVPLLSNFLHRIGLGWLVEAEWLPRLTPYLSRSIIALCQK